MCKINIKTCAVLFGLVIGLAFLALVLAEQFAFSQLKVGGPVYKALSRDNALLADVLPPPEYIVEAYLEATMAMEEPDAMAGHRGRLELLHRQYEERRLYWLNQPINPEIKNVMVRQSDPNVQIFWTVTENSFIPALADGNTAQARSSFARMQAAFQAHRNAISEVIALQKEEARKTEAQAIHMEAVWLATSVGVAAAIVVLLVIAVAWLKLSVVRPLSRLAHSIRELSRNQHGEIVRGRNDEIGEIASAVSAFRHSLIETNRLKAELAENQIAVRAAEEANRAKSAFLANMSHELRTPLNAVIGFSDLMIHGVCGPLSGKNREYAELISQSGQHLLDIISDILDMAKIEAGRFDLVLEEVSLDKIVADCVRMVSHRVRAREAQITVSGARHIQLTADRRALRQMLLNLLSNAAKFCSHRGKIEVKVGVAAQAVIIEVRDDGCGIPADRLSRLGQPFEQVTEDSNLARGGTGLGLALVFAMAKQHNGLVAIESMVGKGTIVRITLPDAGCLNLPSATPHALSIPA